MEKREHPVSVSGGISRNDAPVRVGVVGAGYWGPNIIRNVLQNPLCALAAVCDKNPGKLQYLEQQLVLSRSGVALVADFDRMLRDAAIDAVAIVTNIQSHFELARQALESGKHVFVEKPLSTASGDCRELGRLAREQRKVLMVGHTFIYNPAVEALKNTVDSGELGNIYYLHAQRLNLGRAQTSVNALWSLSVHDVAIALHVFGEMPSEVRCWGQAFITHDVEDVVFLHLRFPSGRMAHLHASWLDPEKRRQVTIVGDRKMVVYDDVSLDQKISVYDKGIQKTPLLNMDHPEYLDFSGFQLLTRVGDMTIPKIEFEEPLKREIQHFVDCIRGKYAKPYSSWEEGYNVVRVLELAQESLKLQGAPIAFS